MNWPRTLLPLLLAVLGAAGSGCQTQPVAPRDGATATAPADRSVLRSVQMDRALEDRILALDPERISADDVRNTLGKGPAPRIVLITAASTPFISQWSRSAGS